MTGGGGLSNLGTILVIIFAVTLLALFTQIFYAWWRRRVFLRRANTSGGDDLTHYSSSESTPTTIASSKELLYFFCVRPQFLLDHTSLTPNSASRDLNQNLQSDVEVIDVDLLKIQGMFGPPRFLFTIGEDEKENLESPARITLFPAAEKEEKKSVDGENGGGMSLDEYLRSEEESVVAVDIDDSGGDDATPFSTPCASPAYFTPSASPIRDVVNGRSTGVSPLDNGAA